MVKYEIANLENSVSQSLLYFTYRTYHFQNFFFISFDFHMIWTAIFIRHYCHRWESCRIIQLRVRWYHFL